MDVLVKTNIRISIPKLMSFAYESKQETYAKGKGIVPQSRIWIPGNKEHEYTKDGLYYRDSYCGFLAAPGREWIKIVGEHGLAVWSMSYDGGMKPPYDMLTPENVQYAKRCFDFLKLALQSVPEDMPLRGPMIFTHPDYPEFTYQFHLFTGDFTRFTGAERIIINDFDKVFEQQVSGGLVIHK